MHIISPRYRNPWGLGFEKGTVASHFHANVMQYIDIVYNLQFMNLRCLFDAKAIFTRMVRLFSVWFYPADFNIPDSIISIGAMPRLSPLSLSSRQSALLVALGAPLVLLRGCDLDWFGYCQGRWLGPKINHQNQFLFMFIQFMFSTCSRINVLLFWTKSSLHWLRGREHPWFIEPTCAYLRMW